MPPIETFHRHQTALLWELAGTNAYGEVTVRDEVEILVRWIDERQEMRMPDGSTVVVDATVVVAQEIPIGSKMWLGDLDSWTGTGTGSAGTDDEVMQVVVARAVPDLKNRNVRRTVGLMKHSDASP